MTRIVVGALILCLAIGALPARADDDPPPANGMAQGNTGAAPPATETGRKPAPRAGFRSFHGFENPMH